MKLIVLYKQAFLGPANEETNQLHYRQTCQALILPMNCTIILVKGGLDQSYQHDTS